MKPDQITALASECAEGNPKIEDLKTAYKCEYKKAYEYMLRFLLRRYCLVEKSKAADLCRLTLEHSDSVDYGLIDGLTDIVCEIFHEIYNQVADNPDFGKEVES